MDNNFEEVEELNKRMAQLLERKGKVVEMWKKDIPVNLPEEIWEAVFAYLTGDMDLWNCSRAYPIFRRILQPKVAPRTSNYIFYEFIPYIYKHLTGKEILKCRKVSKTWSAGVDNLFENHKSLRPHQDWERGPISQPFVTPMQEKGLGSRFTITNGSSAKFFGHGRRWDSSKPSILRRIRGATGARNPFIGRIVTLDYSLELPELQLLLEKFGHHIWYLTVTIYYTTLEPGLLKLVTVDQARLLPNLRSLRIVGFNSIRPVSVEPLTLSPTLETLQIDRAFSSSSTPRARALLEKYHLQLGRLHVGGKDWEEVAHLDWPKLKELHVNNLDSLQSIFRAKISNMSKFGFDPVPRYNSNGGYLLPGGQLLADINKLFDSTHLSTLRFSQCVPAMLTEIPRTVQAHSQLKTLEVEHDHCPYRTNSYDFLLSFPFLENLHIFWRKQWTAKGHRFRCDPEIQLRAKKDYDRALNLPRMTNPLMDEVEVVQVHKFVYQGEMYKSNIWGLLPRLQVLTFQEDVYTREKYERFLKWEGTEK